MPCPFTGPKMFCAGPNFWSQPKNLTAFSASSIPFVPAQKPILLNANHLFVWHKMFVTAKYVNTFLVWHKKFGPAQNILGPIKGQSIIVFLLSVSIISRIVNIFLEFIKVWSTIENDIAPYFIKKYFNKY